MNMGVTLAVYGTIARETGRPFVFPGSPQQWEGLTDVTDMNLGREIEVVTDMTKSRLAGFNEYQPTLTSILGLFARLRRESIIPI
jgi:hypothetical protein